MIENIIIKNGELSPEFDTLNNKYTVIVDENTSSLVFEIDTSDDTLVNIINNYNFNEGDNYVYVEVNGNEDSIMYEFIVYKEKTTTVFNEYNDAVALSVPIEDNTISPFIIVPSISIVSIILLIIVYKILFKKS